MKAETWVQHYWTVTPTPTPDGMLPAPPKTEWDIPLIVFPPNPYLYPNLTRESNGRTWKRVR